MVSSICLYNKDFNIKTIRQLHYKKTMYTIILMILIYIKMIVWYLLQMKLYMPIYGEGAYQIEVYVLNSI